MRVFTRWDEVSTSSETNSLLSRLALLHSSRIHDTRTRDLIISKVQTLDFEFLCSYEPDYAALSVYDSICVRQVLAFFSKRSDVPLKVNRKEAAVRKFIESEDLCRMTNLTFDARSRGDFCFLHGTESRLFRAQRKIASILGDVPSLSDLKIRFGPGATTQVKKRKAHPRRKLSCEIACSEDMISILGDALCELPLWVDTYAASPGAEVTSVPVQIHDGRLDFVPKSAKTDRAIVVEPSLNTMFQAGVGDYIARRLRTRGIDIRDQTRNQGLARVGSIDGSFATLDLSSASDTVSTELVYDLLPWDWCDLLSSLRTSRVAYHGVRLLLEKFSSMGNGFTFPLETLIFYALACACAREEDEHLVSVYGDDIIVPTYAYDELVVLLRVCGFILNTAKSFSTGPFRESCGHDYNRGINIRPCYVKGPLAGFDVFHLHNFFVRAQDAESASILAEYVGPQIRIWGPDGYGDGHLLGAHPARPHGRADGWSGYTFDTFTFRSVKELAVLSGDRLYPFYATYVQDESPESAYVHGRGLLDPRQWAIEDERQKPLNLQHRYIDGRLETTLPGVKSYNRIKIYVLASTP